MTVLIKTPHEPHVGRDQIVKIEFWPFDIPITDPFVVATGAQVVAENVFVRITLRDGAQGYGESAPFPEVGGETRDSCLAALRQLATLSIGASAGHYAQFAAETAQTALAHPAARCGLETAMIDASCRSTHIPLWQIWGGQDVRSRETDITIPIATLEKSVSLARS